MRYADAIAGLCVAGLMLPEAVAYAGIAGLPPQHAILGGIAGCAAYAAIGRSRFAIVSATSSSAVILAATLAAVPAAGVDKAALAVLVVATTAVLFLIAAVARLGSLTGFISPPVLRGFALGIAVTIILHQWPLVTGVPVAGGDLAAFGGGLVRSIPDWHWRSVALGAGALAALLVLRRWPAVPGAFIVPAVAVAASMLFDLPAHGIAVVGRIDTALRLPSLHRLEWGEWLNLGRLTVPLVLILFAESWGTIRTLALRHGDDVAPDRELAALGIANAASAVVTGMPVGAGFSAGSAAEAAGAASSATAMVAATGLLALFLFAAPALAWLPEPVLAAVVIAALMHALDPAPLLRLWRIDRDQYVALTAAAGVLVLGVIDGMLAAILLSLAALVHRLASPRVARLGQLGDSHDFVDLTRHGDAVSPPGIAIWRPTAPLFFANADRMLGEVSARTLAEQGVGAVVLSLEESYDLDSAALDALVAFDTAMTRAGRRVQLARLHDSARDLLRAAGAAALDARSSYSVADAVAAVQAAPPIAKDRT